MGFVHILLPNSDLTETKKNNLKKYVKTKLESRTNIRTEVLLNVSQTEVKNEIGELHYYIPLNVDRFNKLKLVNPINKINSGDFHESKLKEFIKATVENGLEEVGTDIQATFVDTGTTSDKIFVHVLLPGLRLSRPQKDNLKNYIKTKLQSQIGITTEVLLNATNSEVGDKIRDMTDFYYIPLTVGGSNDIVRGDSI